MIVFSDVYCIFVCVGNEIDNIELYFIVFNNFYFLS